MSTTASRLIWIICSLLMVLSVHAQDETNFYWTGAGTDQHWSNPANWDRNEVPHGLWHRAVFGNVDDALRTVDVDINVGICRMYIGYDSGDTGYVFNSLEGGDITFVNDSSSHRQKLMDSESTLFDTVFNVTMRITASNSDRILKSANGLEFVFNNPVTGRFSLFYASRYRFRSDAPYMTFNTGVILIADPPPGITNTYSSTWLNSGAEMIKEGAGTVIFTGTKTYSAATRVSEGRLEVNTAVLNSAFTVEAGGILAGTGTNGATTVEDLGILSAGTTVNPGTLTLNGLDLAGDAVLQMRLDTPGDPHDSLHVAGDLTLDGVLNVVNAGGMAMGTYTIMTYTGTLTDNGLEMGTRPPYFHYRVLTDTPGEINLECMPPTGTMFRVY